MVWCGGIFLYARGDASHWLHVRLQGRPAHRPHSFALPSPRSSRAPSCLSPGAHGALVLDLGSLPGPHAFVSLSTPWVPPTVTCALARTASARILPMPVPMPLAAPTLADRTPLHSMRCVAACLVACSRPCVSFPCPCPFPAPCSCRALRCPCSVPLCCRWPRRLAHAFALAPCRVRPSLPLVHVLTHSPSRLPSPAPRSRGRHPAPPARCPPLPDDAPGVLLPPYLRQCDAWRRTLGRRGKAALGGYGFGSLVWVWLGLVWAWYFAPSLPSAAAAAAPGEAPGARAGATPRAGDVPGAAVVAAARLAGAAVSASFEPGAPSWGGAAGLAAWAAGAVSSAGAGPRVDSSMSAGAAGSCPAGGLISTAASASACSSRSARVSPAHPGETGERERDRRWWRSSCLGEPSESDITDILVGMRGGRCALPTTSWCICVVP